MNGGAVLLEFGTRVLSERQQQAAARTESFPRPRSIVL
jgi:hypothetical protein